MSKLLDFLPANSAILYLSQFVIQPYAMKNRGMWNDQMKFEMSFEIDECPNTISMIVMPLAISIHWFLVSCIYRLSASCEYTITPRE